MEKLRSLLFFGLVLALLWGAGPTASGEGDSGEDSKTFEAPLGPVQVTQEQLRDLYGTADEADLIDPLTNPGQGNSSADKQRAAQEKGGAEVGEGEDDNAIAEVAETIYRMSAGQGLLTLRTDYEKRRITVIWKSGSDVPDRLQSYLDSSPRGVKVAVEKSAVYSRAELHDLVPQLFEALTARGVSVSSMESSVEGDVIKILVEADSVTPATRSSEQSLERQVSEIAAAEGLTDIPVEVTISSEPLPEGYARTNDIAPFQGGARIRVASAAGTGLCTSGFAVLSGSQGRLLSAAHCQSGYAVSSAKTGANVLIASGASRNLTVDSMLIDPTASPATIPRISRGWVQQ